MDIAIALDDTGSMGGAIGNIVAELPAIISQAQTASGGDLRLGYLTFKDDVTVVHQLNAPLAAVQASISTATASGGAGGPEASDIAKDHAVHNTGGFTAPWRPIATKILILITDAPPGGTDDTHTPGDAHDQRMRDAASYAKSVGIKVSDVFVPTGGDYDGQAAILKEDADTSLGAFITTMQDGSGTADAIKGIIERCGAVTPPPPICPDENIQHWDKIAFSINNPRLAGSLRLTANTPLDIKVLDDPLTVADIKQKVLTFLKAPDNPQNRRAISIIDIEYAIICAKAPSPSTGEGVTLVVPPDLPAEQQQQELNRIEGLQQGQAQPANNTTATTNSSSVDATTSSIE